jgi:hypothetical protein
MDENNYMLKGKKLEGIEGEKAGEPCTDILKITD